jgi:hypothetical protein
MSFVGSKNDEIFLFFPIHSNSLYESSLNPPPEFLSGVNSGGGLVCFLHPYHLLEKFFFILS